MLHSRKASLSALLLITVALLVTLSAYAGGPPWDKPSGGWPWSRPKIHGYNEPGTSPPPYVAATQPAPAVKYTIQITVLPVRPPGADPNIAHVIAHLPENARLWFDGQPTRQTGDMRYFESPPLVAGRTYMYTARSDWVEDGRWVSQVHTFLVHAGDVHCIYLIQSDSPEVEAAVKAALEKLAPEDRKLAEAQRFCAVQEGIRLGAMGVPVKLVLKGQPVFLCCKGCTDTARKNPEQTLERIQRMKMKKTSSSSP